LARSPFANAGARQVIVERLNAFLNSADQKPSRVRDSFFKLPWPLFAEARSFDEIRQVLDGMVAKVRGA
jgi:hypothetical protein